MSEARGARARNIARDAGLVVIPVRTTGTIRLVGGVLELGPGASPDAVATVACRAILARDGVTDETLVNELATAMGFEYVPSREARSESGVSYRAVS
jgi:hypothetical protein